MLKIILLCSLLVVTLTAPNKNNNNNNNNNNIINWYEQNLGNPDDMRGLTKQEFMEVRKEMKKMRREAARKLGKPDPSEDDEIGNLEEGDMAETLDDLMRRRTKRHATSTSLWTMPIHYYLDTTNFLPSELPYIRTQISYLESVSCIRFKEEDASYTNKRLVIKGDKDGCWSYVGSTTTVAQPLNLQSRSHNSGHCMVKGIVQHELMHALGMSHEQSRPDRDSYVTINFDNVISGKEHNFNKRSGNTYNLKYDYASVMHYGPTAFTTNGGDTITSKRPGLSQIDRQVMGQTTGVSFSNVVLMNLHYRCASQCPSEGTVTCTNGGIPNTNTNCATCLCPTGLGGDDCSQGAGNIAACGSGTFQVTSEIVENCVTTPGYGTSNYPRGAECGWLLQAPVGKQIEVRFDGTFYVGRGTCNDYIEVQTDSNFRERGLRFCGSSRPTIPITSTSNGALISFLSTYEFGSRLYGAKACYKLKAVDDCDPNPCQNNGVCTEGDASYTCDCTDTGYTGDKCETPIATVIDCSTNPCENGGVCSNTGDGYTCNCAGTDYTGTDCETPISTVIDCSTNPCDNGGVCTNTGDGYTCNCAGTDYTGSDCETQIDDCDSNPCQNNGVCTDGVNSYACNCQGTGFTGTNCDTAANPCQPNPCTSRRRPYCRVRADGTHRCRRKP